MIPARPRYSLWFASELMFALIITPGVAFSGVTTRCVASGLSKPVSIQSPPKDRRRVFIVEKGTQQIRIIKDGVLLEKPFLDIHHKVIDGVAEGGLLGLAFHPKYRDNGFFFVYYTDNDNGVVLERYKAKKKDKARRKSGKILFRFQKEATVHYGGMIAFGPDGYLYAAPGDDGRINAQDLSKPFGKLLRIDVDHGLPYTVPPDNPFVGQKGALPIIWAYGLRNPWSFSFDRMTGDLWIGDVGANCYEEINFQPSASAGGENYGWGYSPQSDVVAEGFQCVSSDLTCAGTEGTTCGIGPGFTPPILDYDRSRGQCVIGGVVYRGSAVPELEGLYIYADHYQGIRTVRFDGASVTEHMDRSAEFDPPGALTINTVSCFGQDFYGEVYVGDIADGEIYKIMPSD